METKKKVGLTKKWTTDDVEDLLQVLFKCEIYHAKQSHVKGRGKNYEEGFSDALEAACSFIALIDAGALDMSHSLAGKALKEGLEKDE